MVSCSWMSCAHGSTVKVNAVCLLHPWLIPLPLVHLSHGAWPRFLLLSLRFWQGLYPVFPPLHRSEDRAGLPVSFPEGMVSCKPGRGLKLSTRLFRRGMDEPWILHCHFRRNMGLLLHLL